MVILIGGTLLAYVARAPYWIPMGLFISFLFVFGLFLYSYLHFMHKNPDVLRSENFHLSKMAIEHGLLGDSIHGLSDKELGTDQGARLLSKGSTRMEAGE
jgi:hypothetical protein